MVVKSECNLFGRFNGGYECGVIWLGNRVFGLRNKLVHHLLTPHFFVRSME
jgi:hypothetical protein